MIVINEGRVPVKSWCPENKIEPQSKEQLVNLSKMPFIFRHVAAMPDVHWGNGTSVGTVFASQGAVIPAAVGVDIGCGMVAVKTDLKPDVNPAWARDAIEAAVPVGHLGNQNPSLAAQQWPGWIHPAAKALEEMLAQRAMLQMGSLGGGNHFIELCRDENSHVWILLHSGSRNVGKVLATQHIENAKDLMKRYFIDLPDPQLAYLVEGTPMFMDYIRDMLWAQDYAAANRNEILRRVLVAVDAMPVMKPINCHHNYCVKENHFGKNLWVTRKGAVRAQAYDLGIIPGSMGTRSYIVQGLGNPESFDSCPHGAGRRMSRTQARKQFTVEDLAKQTEGVECRKDDGVLDEIPGSYKDIDEVMGQASDLVAVLATLKAFVCVKG